MAARNWTPEQRQSQRDAIQRWRPWTKSTGPKSPLGKAKVSRNAFKGGMSQQLRELAKEISELLREQKKFLRGL